MSSSTLVKYFSISPDKRLLRVSSLDVDDGDRLPPSMLIAREEEILKGSLGLNGII